MLSQENIDKLHMNGIYRCDPVLELLPYYKRNTPYWCKNWTFRVREYNGKYIMLDTYWSTGDDNPIELTDENFSRFEYLFDLDDVRYINSWKDWIEYPEKDRWEVPLNSGGINNTKYVVRRGVKKVKKLVVDRMRQDIEDLKANLAHKERILEGIIDGSIDYSWC